MQILSVMQAWALLYLKADIQDLDKSCKHDSMSDKGILVVESHVAWPVNPASQIEKSACRDMIMTSVYKTNPEYLPLPNVSCRWDIRFRQGPASLITKVIARHFQFEHFLPRHPPALQSCFTYVSYRQLRTSLTTTAIRLKLLLQCWGVCHWPLLLQNL